MPARCAINQADIFTNLGMDTRGIDILLERRHEIEVDGRRFTLYPPSLGVTLMLKGGLELLGLDLTLDPVVAVISAVERDRLQCCRLVALWSCKCRDEAMDAGLIEERALYLESHVDTSELSTLLIELLASTQVEDFLKSSGVTKEVERLRQVSSYKKNDTPTFGGKTIFGQQIDIVLQRYGWTLEYTVWGVSYAALTVLLADKVTQLILSEEERKRVPLHLLDSDVIDGDDPKNAQRIAEMFS